MFNKGTNVLYFAGINLIMYLILLYLNAAFSFLVILFLLSPVFAFWMEYTMLKYGKKDGRFKQDVSKMEE